MSKTLLLSLIFKSLLYFITFSFIGKCLCHEVSVGSGPRFVAEPPSKVHFSNSSGAVIVCSATGSLPIKTWWTLSDGSPVNDVHGLRHIRMNGELVLPPFSANMYRQDIHATIYRCLASNAIGTIRSRDCQVRAVVHQTYKVQVYDEFVIMGNTGVMRCQVPTFVREYVKVIAWIKDEKVITTLMSPKDSRYVILSTGELLIRNASKLDSGFYRCQTRHQLTHDIVVSSVAGQFIVTEPHGGIAPRIWSHSNVKVWAGDRVELVCVAQAWPSPQYRWYKEDESGLISPILSTQHMHIYDSFLVINEVQSYHSGKWICASNNSVGEEKVSIKLMVISTIVVHIEPALLVADIGKGVNFNCSFTGTPHNYHVVWLKDGRPLITDAFSGALNDGRVRLIQPTLLSIRNVIREDAGCYQCVVQSEFESSQATCQLKLGDSPPIMLETFKDQLIVESGQSLSLRCAASASPLPQIKWFLDDHSINDMSARYRVGDYVTHGGQVMSYVNISAARVVDSGDYRCVAVNDAGQTSYSGRINVLGAPALRTSWMSSSSTTSNINNTVTVVSGRQIALRCPVIAYPIESIVWQHNSNTLPVNHRQKIEPIINGVGGKLHIINVHRNNDQGEYWCIIKGSNGKPVKGSIHLIVKVAPLIDGQPLSETTRANQGMKVKLMCSILEGDPPIHIKWFKEDSDTPVQSSHTISLQNSEDYSLLTFKSVEHKDMGHWTCKAWNDVESVNRSTYLIVNVSPAWKQEPKNTYVVLGEDCVIDCWADGSPLPKVIWKKSITTNSDISSDSEHPSEYREVVSSYRHQVYQNGTFFIQEVDKSDAGFYMCQISNGIGAGLSKVIQIIVHSPPYFDIKFISNSVAKGETAIIQCEAQGDPILRVEWQKDKQKISSLIDKRYSTKQEIISPQKVISYLEISSTVRHDSALYTCVVSNNFGTDDTNIQLIVQEVPEPPYGLTVTEIVSRSATISWKSSFSGNSAIIKFTLEYRTNCSEDHSWREMSTATASDNKLILRALIPVCYYEVRMYAENALGRSEPTSSTLVFQTNEEVPGGPPIDVIIETTSSTSLKIKWKPPLKEIQFGKIKGYYIGYKIADSDEPFQYKNVDIIGDNDPNKFETSYVTNLKRKTTYIIVVQSYNSVGAGPRSDEVRVATFDSQPPTSPLLEVISTTFDSITVRWDANQNDIEEKEYVLHFKEDREQQWHQKKLKTKSNQYVLDSSNGMAGIRCGTKYKLFMTASNSLGTGEPSETISARTKGAAPLSPSTQEFLIPNATIALLRLSSWQMSGCPIKWFTFKYKPIHQKQWIALPEDVALDKDFYFIRDLVPNKDYKLLVSAHSDAGVTEAEYNFKTLNTTVLVRVASVPPVDASAQAESLSLFRNITVLLPVIISIIVLCVILGTLLGCMRRQHVNQVVNGMNGMSAVNSSNCIHKTDLRQSTETFQMNDFQCSSKPKFIECQSPPTKSYMNSTSYYSSPHRKSLTTAIIGHQRSEHEYAEPLTQVATRCMFTDEFKCDNIRSANMMPTTVQMGDKMYATIKRSPPMAFT
ncbi:cell adhesion molecule Dscam2-like [Oppia nitens]|uniref:cell adhesion molecule Dscam2-like n=1 Tax=Oppia nitens TaxID=1686743 RepID=UPI0023DC31F7|nr:cell adhesion molecule Dscam2-like [Oppia nitens]